MICKCGSEMIFLVGNEFVELYSCMKCDLYIIRNIEMIDEIIFVSEINK